jgi:hypothetical protein
MKKSIWTLLVAGLMVAIAPGPSTAQDSADRPQSTRDNGMLMLHTCNDNDVADRLDEGVMICSGGQDVGRAITNRQMPW